MTVPPTPAIEELNSEISYLHAEIEMYQRVIDNLPFPLCLCAPDGRIVLLNEKAAAFLSSDGQQSRGNFLAYGQPEHRDAILERIRTAECTGQICQYEDQVGLDEACEVSWLQSTFSPVYASDHTLMGIQVHILDVTRNKMADIDWKKAEQELRDLNETMELAQRMAGLGYWSYDLQTGRRRWSSQMYAIFGRQPHLGPPDDEVLQKNWHPEDWELYRESFKGALLGQSYNIIVRLCVDNDTRFVNTQGYPRNDRDGNIVGLFGTSQDITERKRSEQALLESEEKYRGIFENAVEGFFQSTPQGRFISVNPAFARMLGYDSPEDLVASISDIAQQYYVYPDDRQRYQQRLQENGAVEHFEFQARRKDGAQIWVSNSTRAYFDQKGRVSRYEGIVMDITERKRAEQENELLQAQLLQARKMESIGTLSGGIAHEFNNILGIALGNAELALEDLTEEHPLREFMLEICNACLRGRDIVQQLLSFSHRSDQKKRPFPIPVVLQESLGLLRAVIPANVNLRHAADPALQTIMGEPSQIKQVILHLCTNAAHAMEECGGNLDILIENVRLNQRERFFDQLLEPGAYVCLTVADTGHGIAPDLLDRVFDPFYSTKEVKKGGGMGLTIVLGIVKNHDGGIRIRSRKGQGTQVDCFFPAAVQDEEEENPGESSLPGGHENILFLDDEAALVTIATKHLERLGYRVHGHTDPHRALQVFKDNPEAFDLVITDMTMTGMTGDLFIRQLEQIRSTVKTIICTGYSERMDDRRAAEIGARAYLMKPVDRVRLAITVRNILDESRS